MFCGRAEREVPYLLQGIDGFICSDCVELAHDYLKDVSSQDAAQANAGRVDDSKKPSDIKAFLDQYVIGQDRAKKML